MLGGVIAKPLAWILVTLADVLFGIVTEMVLGRDVHIIECINNPGSNTFGLEDVKFGSNMDTPHFSANGLTSVISMPLSVENILANQIPILDVNFISGDNGNGDWKTLRDTVRAWYRALRLLAIVGLLSILIYIGIRIMLSSNASNKANYKQRFLDWIVAFILLFALPYIMSFTFTVTEELTGLFAEKDQQTGEIQTNTIVIKHNGWFTYRTNFMGLARAKVQSFNWFERFTDIIANTIFYIALMTMTFKFLFSYFKRTFKMAFLTIISPIVAMTYPLDKVSDGKAQGFEMWLNEFIFNALLQPIQYLTYTILIGSVLGLASSNLIYTITGLVFVNEAEKILRKIFQFGKASQGTIPEAGGGAGALAMASAITAKATGLFGGKGDSGNDADKDNVQLPQTSSGFLDGVGQDAEGFLDGDPGMSIGDGSGPIDDGGDYSPIDGGGADLPPDGGNYPPIDGGGADLPPDGGNYPPIDGGGSDIPPDGGNYPPIDVGDAGAGIPENSGNSSNLNTPNSNDGNENRPKTLEEAKKQIKKANKEKRKHKILGINQKESWKKIWGRRAAKLGIGLGSAMVQAGISVTDGKYNPLEGFATGLAASKLAERGMNWAYKKHDNLEHDANVALYGQEVAQRMEEVKEEQESKKVKQFFKENNIDKDTQKRIWELRSIAGGPKTFAEAVEAAKFENSLTASQINYEAGNLAKVDPDFIAADRFKDTSIDEYNKRLERAETAKLEQEAIQEVSTDEAYRRYAQEARTEYRRKYNGKISNEQLEKEVAAKREKALKERKQQKIDQSLQKNIQEQKLKDAKLFNSAATKDNADEILARGISNDAATRQRIFNEKRSSISEDRMKQLRKNAETRTLNIIKAKNELKEQGISSDVLRDDKKLADYMKYHGIKDRRVFDDIRMYDRFGERYRRGLK